MVPHLRTWAIACGFGGKGGCSPRHQYPPGVQRAGYGGFHQAPGRHERQIRQLGPEHQNATGAPGQSPADLPPGPRWILDRGQR